MARRRGHAISPITRAKISLALRGHHHKTLGPFSHRTARGREVAAQARAAHLRKIRRAEREAQGHTEVAKALGIHAANQFRQGNYKGARQTASIAKRRKKQAKQIRRQARKG